VRARLVLVAVLALAAGAHAGDKRSCVKVIDRAKAAFASLARSGWIPVRAEVGAIAKGKKASFERELDAGSYCLFAVTEDTLSMGVELSALDAKGAAIKKVEAVGEAFIPEFAVEAKGKVKLQLDVQDAAKNEAGPYIIVLLQKSEGSAPSTADLVFERLGDRAKAVEESGHEVVWAELDTLRDGKTWTATRKLAQGTYAVEVVSEDDKVKDLEVEFTDGSGKSVAKKEKSKEPKDGHMVSLKGDAKEGDAKVAVSGVFQEGNKDSFTAILIAKK